MKISGAEILVKILIEQEVDTIFGYPGGTVLNIYDSLYDYKDKIKHILTSTEQGAAHAADGYARSTGKTGVAIATSGPGATNLVTGIATAFMDSIPVVYITGSVSQNLIGKDSFQEIFITGVTMPITKHNFVVRDVDKLADTVRRAFKIANTGRKGPVLVDIPKDITQEYAIFEEKEKIEVKIRDFEDMSMIEEIANIINNSQRPIIYCGGGVVASGAYKEVRELSLKSSIPACNSIMGIGVLDFENECYMGMVGMHGRVSTNYAIENSDLIIAIGVRFSDRTVTNFKKFAPNANIIHIDIDASEIRKNVFINYELIGDVKDILTKLLPKIEDDKREYWLNNIFKWRTLDYYPKDNDNTIKPHQIIKIMSEMSGQDSIIVTDVGQHQMWTTQYCNRKKPRQLLTSSGLGTMGYGYGAAIGAKIANPDNIVIHITGDGSFHMNMNECPTAVHYNIKVITIVMNNNSLGMVRQWQHFLYNDRYSQSDFHRQTDYVKLADAFGADGYRCENINEFKDSFAKALKGEKSAIIECIIDEDEYVLPMIPANGTLKDLIVN